MTAWARQVGKVRRTAVSYFISEASTHSFRRNGLGDTPRRSVNPAVICCHVRRRNKLERFSVPKRYLVLISRICAVLVGLIALAVFANVCAYVYLRPALPDVVSLREVQLQVPLRIYTRDAKLIQSIADHRRIPAPYSHLPPH